MDDNSEKLRAQAKEELRQGKIIDTSLYETDMKVLVEELSIYQIELEHQNQELMLSQEQLQQSNDRYLDLFDKAPIGYIIVDSTGIIKDINQTVCMLLESSKKEFINSKISKIIHPDFQDIYYIFFRSLINQKNNRTCDIKLRKANNSIFYGRIQGVCQTHEIEHEAEFRLAISDITSQKEMEMKLLAAKGQTEKNEKAGLNLLGDLKAEMKLRAKNELALRESEIQYKNLANSGTALIWQSGTDKLCFYFNEPWLNFTGRTLEQEYGNGWAESVHPDDFNHCLSIYVSSFDKRIPFEMEYRMRRADGEYRWILDLGTPNYNSVGEFVGYIGHCFDITERKKVEKELKKNQELLNETGRIGKIGGWELDVNTMTSYYSQETKKIYGLPIDADPPKGIEGMKYYPKEVQESIQSVVKDALENGNPYDIEVPFVDANNNCKWVRTIGLAEKRDSKVVRLYGTFQDITDLKLAEEKLKLLEQQSHAWLENSPTCTKIVDLDFNLQFMSSAGVKGLKIDDITSYYGKPYPFHFYPESFKTKMTGNMMKAKNTGEIITQEAPVDDIKGNEIWYHSTIVPAKNDNGRVEYLIIVSVDITERKQAENRLKESEERFQLLFNKAPLGYQSLDIDGHFIEVNQQWLDTLGYEREEVLGKWFGDFLTPMYQDGFRKRFPIFKAQGHIHSEFEMVHKNGSILFIAFDGRIGNDTNGNFKQTHCILQDITESKRVKDALLEAEWKFKALFELGPIGVAYHRMIYDEAGKPLDYYFIDANESYNKLTGVSPKGMTVREAFPGIENDPFDWIGKFGHVAKTGETIRFEQFLEANGRWYDVVGYQYKPDHFVAAFSEITIRKQAQLEQQLSEEKFRAIFNDNSSAIAIINPDTTIAMVNEAYCKLSGYSPEEVIGMSWTAQIPPEDLERLKEYNRLRLLNPADAPEKYEFTFYRKDGQILNALMSVSTIENNNKIIASFTDITERIQAENALKESESRFKLLFEDAPDAMLLADPVSGEIVGVNNAACLLFKKEKSELVGMLQYELHPETNIEMSISSFNDHFEKTTEATENVLVENSIICSDGTEIPVEILGQSIQIGEKSLMFGIFRDISKRKEAEKKLTESEAKFRNFFENSVVGKSITSLDGKLTANKAFCDIIGYSEEELHNLNWKEITHPDDIEMNLKIVKSLLDGEKNEEHWEKRYIHKNGTIVWTEIATTLQRDNDGKSAYFITEMIDITDEKNSKLALKQNEKELQGIIEMSPMAIAIIRQWETIYLNPAAVHVFGASSEDELLNKSIFELIHPDYHFVAKENAKTLAEKGFVSMQEQKYLKTDGSVLDVETQAKTIQYKGEQATLVIINDITERKKTEKILAESERRFRELLSTVQMVSIVLDVNGNIVYCNNYLLEITGWQKEEVIGKNWFKHFLPSYMLDAVSEVFANAIETKFITTHYENTILTKSGEELLISWNNTALYNENGELNSVASIGVDITIQKQAEKALQASEEKFKKAFTTSPDAIAITRMKDGNFVSINTGFTRITGYSEEDILGKNATEINIWADSSDRNKLVKNLSENGIVENAIAMFRTKSSELISGMVSATLIELEGEIHILTITRDITDIKKAEEQLVKSELMLKTVLDNFPGIVFWKDIHSNYLGSNQEFAIGAGLKNSDEVIGLTDYDLPWAKTEADNYRTDDADVIKHKKQKLHIIETQLRHNGSKVWLDTSKVPFTNDKNEVIGVIGVSIDITERKIAEDTINKSQKLLSETEKIGKVGGWEFNMDTFDQIWTEETYDIHELPYNFEATVEKGINFYTPESIPIIQDAVKLAVENGKPFDLELDIITAKGNRRCVHTIGNIDTVGRRVFGFFQDITERKLAEKALRESQELLSLYIKNSPIYSFIKEVNEHESKVLYASENYIEMIGIPGHEMIGKTMYDLFPAEFAEKITQDDWNVQESGEVLKIDENLNDNSYITIKFPIVQGDRNLLAGFTIDITDRKNAELALSVSEERYRNLLKHLETGIVVHAPDSSIRMSNFRASELLGLSNDQMQGKAAIDPEWKFVNTDTTPMLLENYPVQQIITNKQVVKDFVLGIQHSTKHDIIWVNVNGFPVFDNAGEITEIVISFNDVSEQIDATETIKNKNKELESFIYITSHDLRTPLVNIQGFSQRLENQITTLKSKVTEFALEKTHQTVMDSIMDTEIPKSLNFILSNVTKMDALISSLLNLSRTGRISLSIAEIDMNLLINSILKVQNYELTEIGATVKVDSLINCYGDEHQINQMFSNLINNAVKYRETSRGLTIQISSEKIKNKVIYKVKDNGIGIKPELQDKIWDVFYRVNPYAASFGEGIGLSLAKKIVEKHNGKIWVESIPGSGSTFFVELLLNKFEG